MTDLQADLRATLEGARGLPGYFFTDSAVFALERQRLFERSWMCIGLTADAPNPGDLYPVNVFGMPLLIARDPEGLRVFHNVCSHRGAVLVEKPSRGQVRIVCPYHSWSYTLRGELTKTPHVGGAGRHECDSISRSTSGLREIRSAQWCGHVFVNLSGTAAPFETWIAPTAARLPALDSSQMRRDPSLAQVVGVAANWKIIVENFVESYHLPWVHRQLNQVNPMQNHYQILGGHSFLGQGSFAYEGARVVGTTLPRFSGSSDPNRYEALYIVPNLIVTPLADMVFSIIIDPLSSGNSRERLEFFFAGEPALAADYTAARQNSAAFISSINGEDIEQVENVQRGRSSPAFTGGQFSRAQEATSLQFQRQVAAGLLAADDQSRESLVSLPEEDILHSATS